MINLGALQGDIVLNGANEAMQKIKGLIEEIGKGGVQLNDFERGLQSIAGSLDKLGNDLTTKVTLPIVGAGTASFKMAADFTETLSKVDVVFEQSADEIKAWGDTTLEQYGLAKNTSLEMVSYFGDMGTSMQLPMLQAKEMAVSLTELSADMASFKNISVDRAQTALAAVYTGETEALKSLGVVMTVANLEAFAMSEGITKAYKDMTQAEQVTLRYNYVMQATSNAHGDFARTADSASNQLRVLVESLKELALEFGNELIPVILPVIEQLKGLVQTFSEMEDWQKKLVVQGGLLAASLGPIAKGLSGLTTAVLSLNTALKFLTAHPIVAILTAVAGALVTVGLKVAELNAKVKTTNQLISQFGEMSSDALQNIVDETEETVGAYENVRKAMENNIEARIQLSNGMQELEVQYVSGAITLEEYREKCDENRKSNEKLNAEYENLTKRSKELNDSIVNEYGSVEAGIQVRREAINWLSKHEESERILQIAVNNTKDDIARYNQMLMDGSTESTNKVIEDVQLKIEAMQREASAALVVAGGYKGMALERAGLMSEEMATITRNAEEKYNIMQAEIGEMERYLDEVRGMHSERVLLETQAAKDAKKASNDKKKALEDDTKAVQKELDKQLQAYKDYMDDFIDAKQQEIDIIKAKKQEELDALKAEKDQREDEKKLQDLYDRLDKEEKAKIEAEKESQEKINEIKKQLEEEEEPKQRERLHKRLKEAEEDKVKSEERAQERINESKEKLDDYFYEKEYNAKVEAINNQYDAEIEIAKTEMDNLKKVRDTHVETVTTVWEEEFKNSGKVCGKTFADEFNKALDAFIKKKINVKIDITSNAKVDGSHRNGLAYVPYDGYIGELHEGERVLTKEENKQYTNNVTNNNFDTQALETEVRALRDELRSINRSVQQLPQEQQRLDRMGVI